MCIVLVKQLEHLQKIFCYFYANIFAALEGIVPLYENRTADSVQQNYTEK